MDGRQILSESRIYADLADGMDKRVHCLNRDSQDFRIGRIIETGFRLNARRIWASTPQIADCRG